MVIESLLRTGYSQVSDEISYLGVGSYAVLQNANFIISGLLSIVFALGLGVTISVGARRAGRRAELAVAIFGVGIILAGVTLMLAGTIVPEIPAYYAHTTASLIAFVAIIVAQFLTWQAAKGSNQSRWVLYGVYSLLSGIILAILLLVFLLTSFGAYNGLTERMLVTAVLIGSRLRDSNSVQCSADFHENTQ